MSDGSCGNPNCLIDNLGANCERLNDIVTMVLNATDSKPEDVIKYVTTLREEELISMLELNLIMFTIGGMFGMIEAKRELNDEINLN